MLNIDLIDEKRLQELKTLETTELFDAVKRIKVQVERARMENVWMENFFQTNAPQNLLTLQLPIKNQIKFDSKLSASHSVQGSEIITKNPSFLNKVPVVLPSSLSALMKTELCEQETKKLEVDLKNKQKQNFQDVKKLNAEIQEIEISCKEFIKAIREFEKFVIDKGYDAIANRISSQAFISFLKNSTRNGAILSDSIRMKTKTMKCESSKKKRLLTKRAELSSFLRPVDFYLAKIEKKKFQQVNEEKLNHYKGLINDTHSMSSSNNKKQKQLLEASLQLNQISKETQKFEDSLRKIENCVKTSVQEIEELKTSVLKLKRTISTYKAPSVIEYIGKINELDSLKKELKSVDRKKEVLKISIKNFQRKYRNQLDLNKNYP